MRAAFVKAHSHPSKVPIVADAPEPTAGKGEVLVDVYSAGLNFFDILQAQGKYQNQPPLPFALGAEFAGRISLDSPIPPGCPFNPGQRVLGSGQGALAEKMATPWQLVVALPDNMTYDQGAGLCVTWPTSYEGLVGRAELKAGEWLLVTAAAGGVGIAACQIGKAMGAKVIAAAGSEEKIEVAKKHGGADFGINYRKAGWQQEVLKITGGKGVNVIYDPVGMIKDCLKCIAWKGRAVVVGFAGGQIEKLPMNLVLLKNISVVGVHWGAYFKNERPHMDAIWADLLALLASGRVNPVVYPDIQPLENYALGLKDLEDRKTWGKAIVRIRADDSQYREKTKL